MLLGAIRGVPAEKLDWKPAPDATTVLWQLNHCATFPKFIKDSVEAGEMRFSGEPIPELPYEDAVKAFEKATEDFCAFVATVPDAKLGEQMTFPWGTYPISAILTWHEWNNTYHFGQVNYIQLLYGDKEMHM